MSKSNNVNESESLFGVKIPLSPKLVAPSQEFSNAENNSHSYNQQPEDFPILSHSKDSELKDVPLKEKELSTHVNLSLQNRTKLRMQNPREGNQVIRVMQPKSANVEEIIRGRLISSKVKWSRKVSGSSDLCEDLKIKLSSQVVHKENMNMRKAHVYKPVGKDNSMSGETVQNMNMNIPVKFHGNKRKAELTMLSMDSRKIKLRRR